MDIVQLPADNGAGKILIGERPHLRLCDLIPDIMNSLHPGLNSFQRETLPNLIQKGFVDSFGGDCVKAPFRGRQECWFVEEGAAEKLVSFIGKSETIREANSRFHAFRVSAQKRRGAPAPILNIKPKEKSLVTPGKLIKTAEVVEHRNRRDLVSYPHKTVDVRAYTPPSFSAVHTVIFNDRLWVSAATLLSALGIAGKPNSHHYYHAERLIVRGGGPSRPSVYVSTIEEEPVQLIVVGKANAPDPRLSQLLREIRIIHGLSVAPAVPLPAVAPAAAVAALPEEEGKLSAGAQKLFDKVMEKVDQRIQSLELENQILRERLEGYENRQVILEAGVSGLLKPRYRVPAGSAQPSAHPASH